MERTAVVQFLQAVDVELSSHAGEGETLELYLLGRATLILRYGLKLATKDVDLATRGHSPSLQTLALKLFGKGSANAAKWGLYLEGVPEGLPPLPNSYRHDAIAVPGDWKVLSPRYLDMHHLAVSKLRRFHSGDREDLRILADSGELTIEGLEQALDSAFAFAADEEEDPGRKRANTHFRRLVDYLAGRTREL